MLAWQGELGGVDLARVNVTPPIALGHPLGASGRASWRPSCTSSTAAAGAHGVATIGEGGGMAKVLLVERVA